MKGYAYILAVACAFLAPAANADDPAPDSPLVKLLKSGRVPEDRQAIDYSMSWTFIDGLLNQVACWNGC